MLKLLLGSAKLLLGSAKLLLCSAEVLRVLTGCDEYFGSSAQSGATETS